MKREAAHTKQWLAKRDQERAEATRRALQQRQPTPGFAPLYLPTLNEELIAALDEHKPGLELELDPHFRAIPQPPPRPAKRGREPYGCGTFGSYRRGCRCDDCRSANAEALRLWKERRLERGVAIPDRAHGTTGGYGNYGCRCELCVAARKKNRGSKLRVIEGSSDTQEAAI